MTERQIKVSLGALSAVVVLSLALVVVTYRRQTNATVLHKTWQRAINVERWQTVRESDWYVPGGGRMISAYPAIHHWERYQSGVKQDCSWSGTGKDRRYRCDTKAVYSSRPVWETRYDYEIERWVVVARPERDGVDTDPVWPDVSDLRAPNPPPIGAERAGQRISRYTVQLVGDSHTYAIDMSEERWTIFSPGQRCRLTLNIFGQPTAVEAVGGTW